MRPIGFAVFLLSISAGASTLTHAGRLLDANDQPVTRTGVPVSYRLFNQSTGGTVVWTSAGCSVDVRAGLFSTTLGADCVGPTPLAGSALPPDQDRWLEVTVDGIQLEPRVAVRPVPTATLAAIALNVVPRAISNINLVNDSVQIQAGTGLQGGGAVTLGGSTQLGLSNTTVSPGTYTNASITVDAQGRLTSASNGSLPVTQVTAGSGLSASNTAGSVAVDLAPSGVTAGTYSNATITVDTQGRVTSASSGSGLNSNSVGNAELKSDSASLARVTGGALSIDGGGNLVAGAGSTGKTLSITGDNEWPLRMSFDATVATHRSHLLIQRGRAGGAVAAGDTLGGIAMGGRFGSGASDWSLGWNGGAEVSGFATEGWTSTKRGAALGFITTANGSATATEKMRLTGDGNLGVGVSDPAARLEVAGDFIRTIARYQSTGVGDSRDSGGPLAGRTINFAKKRSDTGIRITWTDNFRVLGNAQGGRWEVRFNNQSCTSPSALVYDKYEGATGSNRHDMATVTGTCFATASGPLAAGTVTINTWVTAPPGYGTADLDTGWNAQTVALEAEEVR